MISTGNLVPHVIFSYLGVVKYQLHVKPDMSQRPKESYSCSYKNILGNPSHLEEEKMG